jgi:hypothetical protein
MIAITIATAATVSIFLGGHDPEFNSIVGNEAAFERR